MTLVLISFLSSIDGQLLLWLNGMHTPALDSIMITLTNKWMWIPLSLLLAIAVFHKGGLKRGLICIACIALAVTISDQVCASLIRPAIERLRPSNLNNPISQYVHVVNDYRSGSYGFPSCHGSTTMAIAVFMSLYFKRRAVTLFFVGWSILLCYTRIYLGVHYPGDIIVGMAIGTVSALLCYVLYTRLAALRIPRHRTPTPLAH